MENTGFCTEGLVHHRRSNTFVRARGEQEEHSSRLCSISGRAYQALTGVLFQMTHRLPEHDRERAHNSRTVPSCEAGSRVVHSQEHSDASATQSGRLCCRPGWFPDCAASRCTRSTVTHMCFSDKRHRIKNITFSIHNSQGECSPHPLERRLPSARTP